MERVAAVLFALREYVVLALSVLISLILIATSKGPAVNSIRGALVDQWGAVAARFVWITQLTGALEENRSLRQRNLDLAMQNAQLRDAYTENERLRALLDFKKESAASFVAASITGLGKMEFTNALMIDVGQEDGISKNMSVVTDKGLVGRIMTAGEHHSVVQILKDVNFGISARVLRSRILGIVQWHGGEFCQLSYVPQSADVAAGDTVVTSGHGRFCPPLVPIGVVHSVTDDPAGLFKLIRVRPMVNIAELEEVFVMISYPQQEFELDGQSGAVPQ